MLCLFVLLWLCHSHCIASEDKAKNIFAGGTHRWYGPSYQPVGLYSHPTWKFLRSDVFSYDGANGSDSQINASSAFSVCLSNNGMFETNCFDSLSFQKWYSDWIDNVSFKSGAFEGSIIGLSIGIVLGSIRAISLDGLPHSEDETPGKTLLSHVIGGLLSGALIGLVYVFFKECLFT